jgi:hypothetical protein
VLSKLHFLLIPSVLGSLSIPSPAAPDFREHIQPVFEKNCVRCHNADKTKGGLRMDTHELMLEGGDTADALVPGNTAKSELLVRVHLRPIDEDFMPEEGQALAPEDLEKLTTWIEAGAPWPEGLTLKERKPDPVKRVALPEKAPASSREAAGMLDDILRRENAGAAVVTTPPIDDAAFLRRATIDLIGRIPTMPEVRAYESWGGGRRAQLVEKLLADPRYADRWTIFMADLLRIRSNITGGNQLLAYVHDAVDTGKPYDVLVRELISASGRANANPAVGYILGDDVEPMELAAATSQIFLGVRIGCAMCHDHPFDDWKQEDFYDLAAFFGKTKKVQGRQRRALYTTEGDEMKILWPPENKADPQDRKPVRPHFPFELQKFDHPPDYIARLEAKRRIREDSATAEAGTASLDALLDSVEPSVGRPSDPVLEEAREESRQLKVDQDIYRASELRNKLAGLVTDPRNGFFARAFVNRVWAELLGHGFVEPLDNFSDYTELRHATTLDFLAQEFIASGYDLRSLIRLIMLSDAYQRSHLSAGIPVTARLESELHFSAAPVRRMLSEVLYDSIVVAGHLDDFKWPAGANTKEISRQVRVPSGETVTGGTPADQPAMMDQAANQPPVRGDGYDLESSLKLDFKALLAQEARGEIESMRQMSDEQIAAEKMMAARREQQRTTMKYTTKEVTETVDDNPRFDSAMRMTTPAPPAHFLRVFGQPARAGLGEFRDEHASLRQQLMMLNGRMTHEASRVGPKEPLHRILAKDPDQAIDWAYQEILTRLPSPEEKSEARAILGPTPAEGLADLRWALLNSHEFRFLP